MGWPYVGETFHLYSQNPNTFFASKAKKHGPIFKTHILGCRCVMVSSPEAAKVVLVSRAHLFKPTFPPSKERMLGKQAIFFQQGDYHAKLRKLLLRAFMPEAIRSIVPGRWIPSILGRQIHHNFPGNESNHFVLMVQYAFNVALISILGKHDLFLYREDSKRCYFILEKGYNSMPVNVLGTLFHEAMKAIKELALILGKILWARRQSQNQELFPDLLGSFMEESEGLTDQQIADNIIGVIFAARHTTATVLTWVLKYLAENPAILEAVTDEQEAIKKEEGLIELGGHEENEFNDKSSELLRYYLLLSEKPLRMLSWTVAPKANTFMPFGSGAHACPGNELATMEMLVLLHHLTTKYRWCVVGPQNGIQYGPFSLPQNGLPIKFSLKA